MQEMCKKYAPIAIMIPITLRRAVQKRGFYSSKFLNLSE